MIEEYTLPATRISNYLRLRLVICSSVVLILIVLIAYTVWDSYQERQLIITSVEAQSQSYARALKEHAERTFSEIDLVLKNTVEELEKTGISHKTRQAALELLIRRHAVAIPQISSLAFLDSNGQMRATSLTAITRLPSMAEHPLYHFHRTNRADTLFINPPFKSKMTEKWRFTLSRRVNTASGKFVGIVLAAVEISYFEKFYLSVVTSNNGRFTLATTAGDYLVLVPSSVEVYRSGKKTAAFFRELVQKTPAQTYHNPSSNIAKEYRIVSYSSLTNYPVVAIMSLGKDKALAEWRSTNINRSVTIGILGLVILILTRMLLQQLKLLDQKIQERTSQLSLTNLFLEKEIEDRKQAETDLLEQQHKMEQMASDMALAEERERGRIAGELHDQVGQRLILGKIKLDELISEAAAEQSLKVLTETVGLVEQSIEEIRTLTFQMRPPILASAGLLSALQWLANELQRDYGLHITIDAYGYPANNEQLRYEISSTLFQVSRELLLNVVKHAGVVTAWLTLQQTAEQIMIQVTDKGNGFDIHTETIKTSRQGGFGLYNIQRKLENLGGTCLIDTAPGSGTSITLSLPLKPELLKESCHESADSAC